MTKPPDLLEQAGRVAASAALDAQNAEARGHLGDEIVAAMKDAGITRLYLPRSLGGLEVDPMTCAQVTAVLARADASAGWFVMVANAAKLMAAAWPDALVEALWGDDPTTVVAASGNTPFKGEWVGDALVVNGRNSFVSGCHHAKALLSPVQIGEQLHAAVLPMEQCRIVDNWRVLGMRATGSNDVEACDVRVPRAYVVPAADSAVTIPRNRHYQGVLYRCPSRVVFATYVPVALTLAERALECLAELALNKTPYASRTRLAERVDAQQSYGSALAAYRAASGYFDAELEKTWQRAAAGDEATDAQRAALYLAGTHAVQTSAEVVRLVSDAAGSSALYTTSPLEKIVRDMEVLRHHGFVNSSRYASVAQVFWGVALDYPPLLR